MKNKLYGAILGDIAGKKYEYKNQNEIPSIDKIDIHPVNSLYSDDTIMTLASARSIMYNTDIEHEYKFWANRYKDYGFGKGFLEWCKTPPGAITNSHANGCLMRISPYFWLNYTWEHTLISHNHPDCITSCNILEQLYHEDINHPYWYPTRHNKPIPWKEFEVKALPTIEFVKNVFYSTSSTQEAIKLAISCGGDTDTTASIVGELSNYHRNDLTKEDVEFVESMLSDELLKILKKFNKD